MTRQVASCLLLFGATGDLAQRMLLPSLFNLDADGLLPEDFRIVATAREDLDDAAFANMVRDSLTRFIDAGRLDDSDVVRFLARFRFIALDVCDTAQFARLAEAAEPFGELIIFLSMAPMLFEPAIAGLAAAGLADARTRLALEKPLGHDLASSRAINDAVAAVFSEEQTFRLDHYLGKETVQNLVALRFGNLLFEPLWNNGGIDHVQITVSEVVGLEGRADFYDGAGALRDMVQNHMLQLLALVAMEPPGEFEATDVRDEKVKVLRALRPFDAEMAARHSVSGQYAKGAIGGEVVAGYTDELGSASSTETFVALKVHVDNWRWKGVPFYLRTGKRLPSRQSEILIHFKPISHSIFARRGAVVRPNKLVIRLQPEENVRLLLMEKLPGLDREGIRLREVPLDLGIADAFSGNRRRIAYERLLLDLIEGDPTLFVRRDEIEAQWRWIDSIRAGWRAQAMTPKSYAAGTWGPSAAIALTERDGVSWHD